MKRVAITLLAVFVFSCIDPIDLRIRNDDQRLVVDALITNRAGADTIRLSRSLPFDNTQALAAYLVPEKGASIIIETTENETHTLMEIGDGRYITKVNFNGKIGVGYKVKIETADGKQYQSRPEVMQAVPMIDTITYEYFEYPRLLENASGSFVEVESTGFKMIVHSRDPDNEKNYYRWKARGIFEFFSVTDSADYHQCWAAESQLETKVVVSEDYYYDGEKFSKQVATMAYDRPTYYLGTIEQYSLTESAYKFWKQLEKQQMLTGSMFDPAVPEPITGNISSVDQPNEFAYGFFSASAVTEKSVLVHRLKAANFVSPTPYVVPRRGLCINHVEGATNIRPPGFTN
jgi:hypothetical protein